MLRENSLYEISEELWRIYVMSVLRELRSEINKNEDITKKYLDKVWIHIWDRFEEIHNLCGDINDDMTFSMEYVKEKFEVIYDGWSVERLEDEGELNRELREFYEIYKYPFVYTVEKSGNKEKIPDWKFEMVDDLISVANESDGVLNFWNYGFLKFKITKENIVSWVNEVANDEIEINFIKYFFEHMVMSLNESAEIFGMEIKRDEIVLIAKYEFAEMNYEDETPNKIVQGQLIAYAFLLKGFIEKRIEKSKIERRIDLSC